MFRKMTLGKRIGLGIFIMLVLMVIVGVAGYFGLARVLGVTDLYSRINDVQGSINQVMGDTDHYLLSTYSGESDLQEKAKTLTFSNLEKAGNTVASVRQVVGNEGEVSQVLVSAEKRLRDYKNCFNTYIGSEKEKSDLEGKIIEIYGNTTKAIDDGKVYWTEAILVDGKVFFSDFGKYVAKPSEDNWARTEASLAGFKKAIGDWAQKVDRSEELKVVADKLLILYDDLKKNLGMFHTLLEQQAQLRSVMLNHANTLLQMCTDLGQDSLEKLKGQSRLSINIIFAFIIAALFLGTFYAFFSIRAIVGKIKSAIEGISSGSNRVTGAAEQVSTASRALAEGASEQAASIEETSSSLEEISSMSKQNADHANEAKTIMAEASQVVDKVNGHMKHMAEAIEDITRSSEETGKIIKTIDEIAFQTNLLALNAAVEAARAGEAGAGFAVVADEVRNLAMRAAEAAKSTANLIENTIRSVHDGNELTTRTREAFDENMQISKKVSALVEEIAAASSEQAQGTSQVNMAVAEMDKVVQGNAASAEESASAAQEMNALTDQLKDIVKQMNALVGGGRHERPARDSGTGDKDARILRRLKNVVKKPDTPKKRLAPILTAPVKEGGLGRAKGRDDEGFQGF